ncbi:Gfo/Idh/MocA family oxidoreductase [candidate division KSB1 bacterium]|nr:Gfo/Idh/MocA family oxidoreductase [candidate division KSB1 bacterium]
MTLQIDRRRFLKASTLMGAAALVSNELLSFPIKKSTLQIGIIGVGLRGSGHLENLIRRKDIRIPAICDIDPERIKIAQNALQKANHTKANVYADGDYAYRNLLARDDLDGVIISTPWKWHFPMAIDAMQAKLPPGLEVGGAQTIQECWDLVQTHESTQTPMMLLENVCYRRDIMAVLNMVRLGLFGEVIHCRCGYQHDLRNIKFYPGVSFGSEGKHEAVWRTQHAIERNGDIYPTHGLGPVAMMLNINRGNRLTALTSMASKARGLHEYVVEHGGEDHSYANIPFKLGDVITTTLQCAQGESIVITHDTQLPRPYSLGFRVQGTKGLWMVDGNQIYIEGISSEPHQWEQAQPYLDKYDHPLWKKYSQMSEGAGHGGMDFYVLNAYVEALKRKAPFPIDVYDAAVWRVITPLSEKSIAEGGSLQSIPDFTEGRWEKRTPDFAGGDIY